MSFTRRDFVKTASIGTVLTSLLEIAPAAAEGAPKIVNLDDRVTFKQQLEHNIGPVVLMSTFLVPPDQVDSFWKASKSSSRLCENSQA
jgi:hypothetical protein